MTKDSQVANVTQGPASPAAAHAGGGADDTPCAVCRHPRRWADPVGCTRCACRLCDRCADARWVSVRSSCQQQGFLYCPACFAALSEPVVATTWPAERWRRFRDRRAAVRRVLAHRVGEWGHRCGRAALQQACQQVARTLRRNNPVAKAAVDRITRLATAEEHRQELTTPWWSALCTQHVLGGPGQVNDDLTRNEDVPRAAAAGAASVVRSSAVAVGGPASAADDEASVLRGLERQCGAAYTVHLLQAIAAGSATAGL